MNLRQKFYNVMTNDELESIEETLDELINQTIIFVKKVYEEQIGLDFTCTHYYNELNEKTRL